MALWLYEGLLPPDRTVLRLGQWWGHTYVMGEAVWDQTQCCFGNKEKLNRSVPGWHTVTKTAT